MRCPSCVRRCWRSFCSDLTRRPPTPYNGGIGKGAHTVDKCESCAFYNYDEAYDDYVCEMDLDEDEMARVLSGHSEACPYWRPGDEYRTARKQ